MDWRRKWKRPHELLTAPLVPFPYTINARDARSKKFRKNSECIVIKFFEEKFSLKFYRTSNFRKKE